MQHFRVIHIPTKSILNLPFPLAAISIEDGMLFLRNTIDGTYMRCNTEFAVDERVGTIAGSEVPIYSSDIVEADIVLPAEDGIPGLAVAVTGVVYYDTEHFCYSLDILGPNGKGLPNTRWIPKSVLGNKILDAEIITKLQPV